MAPAPITHEGDIAIPAYGRYRQAYTTTEWGDIIAEFNRDGAQVAALSAECQTIASTSRMDVSGILRHDDLAASCIHWHVQSAGRIMRHRLTVEGRAHAMDQDGMRCAIQDTWMPAASRLRRVATALAVADSIYDAWPLMKDTAVGRACAMGLTSFHQRLPITDDDLGYSLAQINHREVVWAVVAAEDHPWSDRSLLGIINRTMTDGGGKVYRVSSGYLVGGMSIMHTAGYHARDATSIVDEAADAMVALARGWHPHRYKRSPDQVVPSDTKQAVQLAVDAMVPALGPAL
jgi:hypothetical protein